MATTLADIGEFLTQRRIALVGLSRNPKDFSRIVFREMCDRGYDMVPVNPAARELESRKCFGRVQEIDPPAEGALVMTTPRDTDRVVRDCAELAFGGFGCIAAADKGPSVKRLPTSAETKAYAWLKATAPLMFLSHMTFVHRVHGFLLKVLGRYPAKPHCSSSI